MSHLEGICVEYIQALEIVQDRVRELRRGLQEAELTAPEVAEGIAETEQASHVAWHLERALIGACRSAVQSAHRRESAR